MRSDGARAFPTLPESFPGTRISRSAHRDTAPSMCARRSRPGTTTVCSTGCSGILAAATRSARSAPPTTAPLRRLAPVRFPTGRVPNPARNRLELAEEPLVVIRDSKHRRLGAWCRRTSLGKSESANLDLGAAQHLVPDFDPHHPVLGLAAGGCIAYLARDGAWLGDERTAPGRAHLVVV